MSDDDASFRRRRRRDGDSTPESSETPPENDADESEQHAEGADWLLSQLEDEDAERTQAIPVADATEQVPFRRAEEPAPDLTPWWRSSAPSAPAVDPTGSIAKPEVDARDDSETDVDDEPEPRRRSTFQAFTPVLPEVDAVESEPVAEPDVEVAPAPEPESEAVIEPEVAGADEPDAAPTPPLFKSRPDSDRPWVTRPLDGPSEPRRANLPADSSPTVAPELENSSGEVNLNDSAPFVWSLTPNDELDPFVHKTTSATAASSPAVSPDVVEPKAAGSSPVAPDLSAEPILVPTPTPAFVSEPVTPAAVPTETVVIPEIVDDGSDENELTETDETVDDEIIDAEIVEPEPEGDALSEPVSASSSTTPATATFNTEDVDSLAFLMGLEEATAATVASQAVENDQNVDPTENVTGERAPDDDTEVAEPLTRRRAAALAAPADEAPTAVFLPVGPFPEDPAPVPAATDASERPPLPPYVKWIALGVAAVLVLVGLFFVGTRLPSLFGAQAAAPAPSPTATATAPPSARPTPTEPPAEDVVIVGPVAPGEHKWTALLGSECLEPYSTPWAENFTVVDCAAPHRAQMVFTAPVTSDPAVPYPGEAEIASQIALWCSAPGVFDTAAASALTDLQVQGTYPVSDEQWTDGVRNYYCFLSRSTGEPLAGTLAVAQPAT